MGVYVFGRITQTKGIPHLYEITEHQKIEEQVVGHSVKVIFYTHLPFMAPVAAIFVDDDYVASFKRWAAFLLLLNALNVYLLTNLLDLKRFKREYILILVLGSFFFDPTVSGFMNGQDTAFLLLGAIIWLTGMTSKNYLMAGLGLSLTTVRPQMALFLAVPFLFRHRRVFWGFVLGSAILTGISIWLLKIEGTIQFIESLRYLETTIWVEKHAFDMPTLSGVIRRSFAVINPAFVKSFVWMFYLAGIAGFCFWWRKSDEISEKHIGVLTLAAIFLLPYAHYHELTLLLIPIFGLLRILERDNSIQQYYLAVLPLIVSWLSALGFLGSGVMKFPIVYFIMLALGYLLITSGKTLWRLPRLSSE